MEVKCENCCPNCGIDDNQIDWGITELCEGFTKQRASCNNCGTEFVEYYTLVYNGTEFTPGDYENPFGLDMGESCSEQRYNICTEITEEIEHILNEIIMLRKSGLDFADDKIFFNIGRIKMLKYVGVGVGQEITDEKISLYYRKLLEEALSGVHKEDIKEERRVFFRTLHCL